MNAKRSARILVALSVVYGLTVGLLALLGVAQTAMMTFLIAGAVVLGGLWVVRGLFTGRG